jgi:uncharacterized protein YbjT (DUF2867 family)
LGVNDGRRILVTGATGRQGGAVAKALLARRFTVRVLTRDAGGAPACALAKAGAELAQGDFDDPASLANALAGVSGLFAMQTPYEAGIDSEVAHGFALADAAGRAGVEQIIYSSVAAADLGTGVPHFESKGQIERHIASLNFPQVTILRPAFFMEMLLAPGNMRMLARGCIEFGMRPETRIAMIAVDDIAAMAVAAFEEPQRWHGAAVTLAGDEPDLTAVAAAFSAALRRPVRYAQVAYEAIEPDTRPKAGTQQWLETFGWTVDVPKLRASYPFAARTIAQWAVENLSENDRFSQKKGLA